MANDLLGLSVTGLRASQAALNTTGHNISNANTDGYSRQRVDIATNPASYTGVGYVGNGVSINAIERVANEFITTQVRTDSVLFNEIDTYHTEVSALNNLLSNEATGLSSALESFFGSMQNGSNDPTSIPARQLIISEAKNLADRFNSIYTRMDNIHSGVNSSMEIAVGEINALSNTIATLNLKITDAGGLGTPNDLLDQRDETLRKLSELVGIQVFDQGNGQLNVLVGSGQSLVVGTRSQAISLQSDPSDARKNQLLMKTELGVFPVNISGGNLGGLIKFRDEALNSSFNQLGRIAISMSNRLNEQHHQGINLQNQFGSDLFTDMNDPVLASERVLAFATNAPLSNPQMGLYIDDANQLGLSNYEISIEGGGLFRVKRNSDSVEVASGLLPGFFPFTTEFDGLKLQFDGGIFQDGDKFTLRPTQDAAREFQKIIINPEELAFANPLSTSTVLGNLGSGKISSGSVLSLTDKNDQPLPLFAQSGVMNPPLMVYFTSPTTYDILNNTDPGNPVQLDPPIRNQVFVPGTENSLFPTDKFAHSVSARGDLLGLPEGRRPVIQAAVMPAGVAPSFTQTDFSAPSAQFSFDIKITESLSGTLDGTYSVRINQPALTDAVSLVQAINSQLSSSGARAFVADDGSLAFKMQTPGYGNITLENYNADPDGAGGSAPVGAANNLLGFNIESNSFTSIANAQGVSGFGDLANGYPAEVISLTRASDIAGGTPVVYDLAVGLNAPAKSIAAALNNVSGVSATAFTQANITGLNITHSEPLQLQLNGEDLIPYVYDSALGVFVLPNTVPDPVTQINEFNDFIARQINKNTYLSESGIFSSAGVDAKTGRPEIRLYAKYGDDLSIGFTGAAGESIAINDGENPDSTLAGRGNGLAMAISVGGRLDISMDESLSLTTFPDDSLILGNTQAAGFSKSNYLGIQASINGTPKAGDKFVLDFNRDASMDNRNVLDLVNLQAKKTMSNGLASFNDSYGAVIESVGIQTNAAKINSEAAKQVLAQTTQLRDSLSAVNMDEEAANLVKFEQLYSANARVIQVARDLFNTLLQSFG
ncbi:MAG: flagellar hook-associated protein FlgK [Pseudomonadota bacterium]|jgi:flagellar hook-associated protein 1 FlgK